MTIIDVQIRKSVKNRLNYLGKMSKYLLKSIEKMSIVCYNMGKGGEEMLQRKIEKQILNWLEKDTKALLIDGARQVGKTSIIRKVLEDAKKHYIEFNLIEQSNIVTLFKGIETEDDLIANLSLLTDKKFVKGETVLFFDEIQEYKEIVTKIKFLVDAGSFRYIFSGSLLGVELKNIKSAPVGYLRTLTMYPMDFEEFLQLYNFTDELKASLKKSFEEKLPVNEALHEKMMQIFRMYLVVGGMPAAVKKFHETKDLEAVFAEHEDIIVQYKKDFTKYESDEKRLYLTRIYDLIPGELNEKNKRFNFADLQKGLRFERTGEDFLWLEKAGVAMAAYNTTEPIVPLQVNQKSSLFKFFLSDVGLLTTMYGKATKLKILENNEDLNYGAIYENVAAQELLAHKYKLFYYNTKKQGEVDLMIEYQGEVLPVEIKSGKTYQRHSALNNLLEMENYEIKQAFVFNNYNVAAKDKTVYYPIYMLMFVNENEMIQMPKVEIESF